MDVKEAVGMAKSYVADLFADETLTQVGLEEVVFDELSGDWKITIGFAPLWNQPSPLPTFLGARAARSYKVVRLKDHDGQFVSLTDRLLAERTD
jgi:hypothetical protein